MTIWAIGDLHLSTSGEKPMDVFGERWRDHHRKIDVAWRERVGPEDIVLVPGDTSWAMRLAGALPDLEWLARLPGRHKVLIRGNHDYWWASQRKLEELAPRGFHFIQGTAVRIEGFLIAGTRGWEVPGLQISGEKPPEPSRPGILERELGRLERSLSMADELRSSPEDRLIVLLHYPPVYRDMDASPFTDILDRHRPFAVVYAHLHGDDAHRYGFQGERGGTRYLLASADYLGFKPERIFPAGGTP